VKASPADLRRALAGDKGVPGLVLLFGPDEGASMRLAGEVAASLGADAERIDLAGSALKTDPARLRDEAGALSLFGTPRYVRVLTQGEECHDAVANLLEATDIASPVVVIASGITDKARLAKLVLAAPDALAVYSAAPNARQMEEIVAELARAAGLSMDRDTAATIAGYTGLDQRLAAIEVEKLALYLDAAPDRVRQVDHATVQALSAGHEDDAMQPIINAALGGDLPRLGDELRRMREQGISEVGLVIVMQRQVMQLAQLAARLGPRGDIDGLVESEARARRLFGDKHAFKRQLARWPQPALARLAERLLGLQQRMMAAHQSAELMLRQELLEIGAAAARAS